MDSIPVRHTAHSSDLQRAGFGPISLFGRGRPDPEFVSNRELHTRARHSDTPDAATVRWMRPFAPGFRVFVRHGTHP